MKKAYTAPKAESIDFYMEGAVAIALMSASTDPTINDDAEILSNKKENPIWGEQKSGMWDKMN